MQIKLIIFLALLFVIFVGIAYYSKVSPQEVSEKADQLCREHGGFPGTRGSLFGKSEAVCKDGTTVSLVLK